MTIRDTIRYRDERTKAHIALFQAVHGRAPLARELRPLIGAQTVSAAFKQIARVKRLYGVRRDGRLFVIPGIFTPRQASA